MKIDLPENKSNNPSEAFMSMLNMCGNQGNEKATETIQIEKLVPFPDHATFHKYDDEKLKNLSMNIREYGVLSPVIVRPLKNGNYQILAGHNRTAAAKLAGLSEIPCIVKDCDEDTAKVIFVATNLNQREKLLPSEKAFAYKMLLESSKCRSDTAQDIKDQSNTSRSQIFRYIRLTYLLKPFILMIDDNSLNFMVGVNLSYLDKENQESLLKYITDNRININLPQSEKIKDQAKENILTDEFLDDLLLKKASPTKRSIKIPLKTFKQYFDGMEEKEIIEKLLNLIKNHLDEL